MPLVEREMVSILEELLGGAAPAQVVFYSIINNQTRIDVMKALLESSAINVDKDQWFDFILDEYKAVGKIRNEYAHGLWWTHDSGRVFVEDDTNSPAGPLGWREVSEKEATDDYNRLIALHSNLREHNLKVFEAGFSATSALKPNTSLDAREEASAADNEVVDPERQSRRPRSS